MNNGLCNSIVGAPAKDLRLSYLTTNRPIKPNVILSCFADGNPQTSFNWATILTTQFPSNAYQLTMLLHGDCLKYGLANDAYLAEFGVPNPFENILISENNAGVNIVICQLCLTKDGFNDSQLLDFIIPVPFSVQYIIQQQLLCGSIVIYDS